VVSGPVHRIPHYRRKTEGFLESRVHTYRKIGYWFHRIPLKRFFGPQSPGIYLESKEYLEVLYTNNRFGTIDFKKPQESGGAAKFALFDNPVGCLAGLAIFQTQALQDLESALLMGELS
jgi:hypothetical protein